MATPSATTGFIGPIVSLSTALSDAGPQHMHIPSTATLTGAGTNTFTGAVTSSGGFTSTSTINAQAAVTLSKQTTASLTSATLKDGEFAIGAVSATSCMIYFRSGVTTYRFLADAATLL